MTTRNGFTAPSFQALVQLLEANGIFVEALYKPRYAKLLKPGDQVTGIPLHTPSWHASPSRQALPVLHRVPLGLLLVSQASMAGDPLSFAWKILPPI